MFMKNDNNNTVPLMKPTFFLDSDPDNPKYDSHNKGIPLMKPTFFSKNDPNNPKYVDLDNKKCNIKYKNNKS